MTEPQPSPSNALAALEYANSLCDCIDISLEVLANNFTSFGRPIAFLEYETARTLLRLTKDQIAIADGLVMKMEEATSN